MLELLVVLFAVGIVFIIWRYREYHRRRIESSSGDQVVSRLGWIQRMRVGGFFTPRRILVLCLFGILVVMYFTHPTWVSWLWDNLWKGEGHQRIFFGALIALSLGVLLLCTIALPDSALFFLRKYWWLVIGIYSILVVTALLSDERQEWLVCWEKIPTQSGKIPRMRGACYNAAILSKDNRLRFMVFYWHNKRLEHALFEGQIANGDHYIGTWSQEKPGDAGRWELTKVGSVFHGWHTDKTTPERRDGIPFLLKPKERGDEVFERT